MADTRRFTVDEDTRKVTAVFGVPVLPGIPDSDIRRFGQRFEPRNRSGCWDWTAGHDGKNYPLFWNHLAGNVGHRFSYTAFVGPIPEKCHVHHKCENTMCVNPDHLKAVTPREHVLDYTPNAITAIAAAKTHCLRGHELTGYNLLQGEDGKRHCRTCKNEWSQRKRSAAAVPKPTRTHCKNGHEWIEANLAVDKHGKKVCRICRMERAKEFRARVGPDYKSTPLAEKVRTHCKYGHELSGDNIYMANGYVSCALCKKLYWQKYERKSA